MEKQIEQFGVQAWSQGELYPAVISTRETYATWEGIYPTTDGAGRKPYATGRVSLGWLHLVTGLLTREEFYALPLESRLRSRSFVLSLDGQEEEYSSRDDAAQVARALISSPFMRAQWQQGREFDTAEAL